MRAIAAILGLGLLPAAAAVAGEDNWQVKCGLDDNPYPYANDPATRFGVAPQGTWSYDDWDAPHPPIPEGDLRDLAFIYSKDYYKLYRDYVLHDVGTRHWTDPVGWPPPWKPWIGGIPAYPSPGLLKDIREPIVEPLCPELWRVMAYAPNAGETCSFVWYWCTEPGYEVPPWIQVQVWGNPDLEAVGVYGDLVLNEFGPGEHRITGIPQWGMDEDDIPIMHYWVIQATSLVPEPGAVSAAGFAVGFVALVTARLRRQQDNAVT
jgi:hypothetical protein